MGGKQEGRVGRGDGVHVDGVARPGGGRAGGLSAVLSRWRWLRPGRRTFLVIDDTCADPEELRGRPGAIVLFRFIDGRREANVCCPGCGQGVFFNDCVSYPLTGPEDRLSCPVRWTTPCCGWTGRLCDGYWIGH